MARNRSLVAHKTRLMFEDGRQPSGLSRPSSNKRRGETNKEGFTQLRTPSMLCPPSLPRQERDRGPFFPIPALVLSLCLVRPFRVLMFLRCDPKEGNGPNEKGREWITSEVGKGRKIGIRNSLLGPFQQPHYTEVR